MNQTAKFVREVAGEIRRAVAAFDKADDSISQQLAAMDRLDALGFGSAAVAEMVADTMDLSADAAIFNNAARPSLRRTFAVAEAVRAHQAEHTQHNAPQNI